MIYSYGYKDVKKKAFDEISNLINFGEFEDVAIIKYKGTNIKGNIKILPRLDKIEENNKLMIRVAEIVGKYC